MIRHILTIIRNERAHNLGIVLELFLVAAALWFLVDYVFVVTRNYLEPLNFDTEHTYIMRISSLSEESPEYDAAATGESIGEQAFKILERVRLNPMIEAASFSIHSSPHIGSNSNWTLFRDTINTKDGVLRRLITPGFFHVFRYRSVNGSTDELSEAMERGEYVLSESVDKELFPEGTGLRKTFRTNSDLEAEQLRIGAISTDIRYDNFRRNKEYFTQPLTVKTIDGVRDWIEMVELCVRVKPEEDHDFIVRFREQMTRQMRVGNLFLKTIESIPVNKKAYQLDDMNDLKMKYFIMFFLLVNIFLGISGTFWFRTQARRGEIGLRLALGDTPGGIMRMFNLEGALLLAVAIVPVMILFLFAGRMHILRLSADFGVARYFIGLGITFVLLLGMILLGILFPARKALSVSPVDALRDE